MLIVNWAKIIINFNSLIKYVNNSFEKVTGYALNEINGQDFKKIHNLEPYDSFLKQLTQGNVIIINKFLFKKPK